jgi:hypothetical protein
MGGREYSMRRRLELAILTDKEKNKANGKIRKLKKNNYHRRGA